MLKVFVILVPLSVIPFEYKDSELLVLRSASEGGENFAEPVGSAVGDVFVGIVSGALRLWCLLGKVSDWSWGRSTVTATVAGSLRLFCPWGDLFLWFPVLFDGSDGRSSMLVLRLWSLRNRLRGRSVWFGIVGPDSSSVVISVGVLSLPGIFVLSLAVGSRMVDSLLGLLWESSKCSVRRTDSIDPRGVVCTPGGGLPTWYNWGPGWAS